jgi:hypothetical protein
MAKLNPLLRTRFWAEAGLAVAAGLLAVLTTIWHDWLEAFGFDPDHHSGAAEWLIVGLLSVCFVASTVAARLEWRRSATALASSHQM